jgi:multiple sugar transport system substrate-binding protein
MKFKVVTVTFLATVLVMTWLLSGCSGIPMASYTATPEATPENIVTPIVSNTPTQELQSSPTPGPVTLRLWVPPQLDPASGTPAGDLLQSRLETFTKRRPGVRVEVRVKALEGPAGMLETLAAASAAAPLARPSLMALPRELLESAALKGLLYSYDNLSDSIDDEDWYAYAQDMAHVQSSVYGLPFAGDALVMAYHPEIVPEPPNNWALTIEGGVPLIFPAADPLAIYTLSMYQANGGQVIDDGGAPALDADVLSQVLTYFAEAESVGVMPFWVTQYQTFAQVWEAFNDDRSGQAVIWASMYLAEPVETVSLSTLPTLDGEDFSVATGWVWALTTPPAENQKLSVELAEFLTDGDFLEQWSPALGYLPVRPSALSIDYESALRMVLSRALRSATPLPPDEILLSLGFPLQVATGDVLKQQADPITAAQAAVTSLSGP